MLNYQENNMDTPTPDFKNEWMFLSDDKVFYTLEGEGRYVGYPSVFIRTSLCNLTCKGFASKDSPFGCDSFVSWSVKNKMTFEEIALHMERGEMDKKLKEGAIFKITGGEPFIWQDKLFKLCHFLMNRWGFTIKIDFETNGTILPNEDWVRVFDATYTTSPKLSNNGDPIEKRYKPEVLKWLVDHDACFKFVIGSEPDKDIKEITEMFIENEQIKLPKHLIWFMPCCGSRKELLERGPIVAELAKKHCVNFSNRMQLQIWDKALKV